MIPIGIIWVIVGSNPRGGKGFLLRRTNKVRYERFRKTRSKRRVDQALKCPTYYYLPTLFHTYIHTYLPT